MMSFAEVTAPARTGRVALFDHLSANFMRRVGDKGNRGRFARYSAATRISGSPSDAMAEIPISIPTIARAASSVGAEDRASSTVR